VDEQQYSFTELAERLARHTGSADVIAWWEANPTVWIAESARIRDRIYPDGTELGYDYAYRHTPTANLRLQQAGVRLAAYLNALFDPPMPGDRAE
ncbi:MAG TPA: S1/P1 nuclease, partial [Sphingomicrobium sp.]|nr:S1/P1 nuclease [Sphingomicrobium sp.]